MSSKDWFVLRAQQAQAYGRPVDDGFLVRKGSTAMRDGSPIVKRDREERDRLVREGVLVLDGDIELFCFSRDHVFGSSSSAGGTVKDGNCSGPQSWRRNSDGKTLQQALAGVLS